MKIPGRRIGIENANLTFPEPKQILSDPSVAHNDPDGRQGNRKPFSRKHLRPKKMTAPTPPKTAPAATLQSLQIGRVITEGDASTEDPLKRQWTTAFYKTPITGPIRLTRLGLAGDAVSDRRHHGGTEKAALCYAAAHYDAWQHEHPTLKMAPGGFAENLTIAECEEQTVCIGDRYGINDCRIEISQPRQPCWKISRRWGIETMTQRVTQTGRTGWYLRVLTEGTIDVGNQMKLLERPNPSWPIARANDILFGRETNRMAIHELMNLPELSDEWKQAIG